MGSPTMSTQSPQTGGKSNQLGQLGQQGLAGGQGSAGGKGMAGGAMDAATQQMPPVASQDQTGMGQGNITYPSQSGQPVMGMPNAYSNTIGKPNTPMTPMNSGAGMPGGKGSQPSGKTGV